MYLAEVGDAGFDEDPTVRRLEDLASQTLNMDAAIFVPSGTMANLIAVLAHCQRGDEMIVGRTAHIFRYECGGVSALGGILVSAIDESGGVPSGSAIAAAVRTGSPKLPVTRLLCIENSHNDAGGLAVDIPALAETANVARAHGLQVHMDGARIFNAAVALRVPASDLAQYADSVSFCLSKGLCGPVGSLLCGSLDFMDIARSYRRMAGGVMRQAGIVAAAGIVALECMIDRLAEDHARASRLAEGLADIAGVVLRPGTVTTNIVYFEVGTTTIVPVIEALKARGILTLGMGQRIRMVTHRDVSDRDIEWVLEQCGVVIGSEVAAQGTGEMPIDDNLREEQ
jgi:threonine aldolase